MINIFTPLIIASCVVLITSSEGDYNNNLLPLVQRKFHRIDSENGYESRIFSNVNRSCVMELLELIDDGVDYTNLTGDYLNLRNDAINKAFEVCNDRKFVMSEDQMQENLKNHKSEIYSEKIDCFKLELSKLEPESKLLEGSNLIFNNESCIEILGDFETKLMKGFNDYKNRIVQSYNLTTCNVEDAMKIGRKIALRYVVMSNGDYSNNDAIATRNIFTEDAEEMMKEIVKCFVIEMKSGNYGS